MQKRKGISLIVLVITIIVMIVLAGAIILSLNNSGIIQKANEAVKSTDEATIKELAQMAWAEAYADGVRTVEDLADGTKGFNSRIKEALAKNNLNTEDYGIIATTTGVEIAKGWLQKGITVTKGDKTLNVGELVAYDETKGGTVAVDKNVTWKVLGAENGELLIVSADSVVTSAYGLGDVDWAGDLDLAKDAVLNGITNLNTICAEYGKGTGAVSSRSITVEDVNKVTGYNPETAGYGKDTLYEYGNKVTYTWKGSTDPYYTATNGLSGTLEGGHGGSFIYYDGKDVVTSTNTGATVDAPKAITTLTSDAYFYYATTLTTSSSAEKKGLATDSEAYKMLFRDSGNTKNDNYWLASPFVLTNSYYAYFGLRIVSGGFVNANDFLISDGETHGNSYGVRAVVSLGSDVVFTGTTTEGLTF